MALPSSAVPAFREFSDDDAKVEQIRTYLRGQATAIKYIYDKALDLGWTDDYDNSLMRGLNIFPLGKTSDAKFLVLRLSTGELEMTYTYTQGSDYGEEARAWEEPSKEMILELINPQQLNERIVLLQQFITQKEAEKLERASTRLEKIKNGRKFLVDYIQNQLDKDFGKMDITKFSDWPSLNEAHLPQKIRDHYKSIAPLLLRIILLSSLDDMHHHYGFADRKLYSNFIYQTDKDIVGLNIDMISGEIVRFDFKTKKWIPIEDDATLLKLGVDQQKFEEYYDSLLKYLSKEPDYSKYTPRDLDLEERRVDFIKTLISRLKQKMGIIES